MKRISLWLFLLAFAGSLWAGGAQAGSLPNWGGMARPVRAALPGSPGLKKALWQLSVDPTHLMPQLHLSNNGGDIQLFMGMFGVDVAATGTGTLQATSTLQVSDTEHWTPPAGGYWLTFRGAPGPYPVTVTAYTPVAHLAIGNGPAVGSCRLPPGNYHTTRTCSIKVPTQRLTPGGGVEVNLKVSQRVFFDSLTLGYYTTQVH